MTDNQTSTFPSSGITRPATSIPPTAVDGPGQSRTRQSSSESLPGPLVAPLSTHGLLEDPARTADGLPTTHRDSTFPAETHQHKTAAVYPNAVDSLHEYHQPPTHGRNEPEDSPYIEQAPHVRTDRGFESKERRLSPTPSTPLDNITTRGTTQRGSSSHHEALMGDHVESSRDQKHFQRQVIFSKQSGTSYPPLSSSRVTRIRKYQRLRKQSLQDTHYFLKGHLMTGGDNIWPLIGSIILLLGLGGLWLGTTGVWVWRDGLGGGGAGRGGKAAVIIFGYLLGVCFGAMVATAFRDPGELSTGGMACSL